MKERDLRKVLTKPTTDETMDQKITDSLLNPDLNDMNSNKMYSRNIKSYRFSKVAVIVAAFIIIGTGTVLAATRHFVKSYPSKRDVLTEEEYIQKYGSALNVEEIYEEVTKKYFGPGNKKLTLPRDSDGNLLEVTDDGYVVFPDGSSYKPIYELYTPDPDRHEKAKKSGDEAFAYMGYPNLVPTYIYDNYVLGEKGFCIYETTRDGYDKKWTMTEFFKDAYDTGDFSSEVIHVTFSPAEHSTKNSTSILVDDNTTKDDYAYSTYTTKGGILCSLSKHVDGNIIADINFDSDTIGNGHMMIEFIGFSNKMDTVKEILDTLPLTEDIVDYQDTIEE